MSEIILAGIRLKNQKEEEFLSAMDECRALCDACGLTIVGEITQNSSSVDLKTAFRSGKLEELAMLVQETNAKQVIFYNSLRIQTAQRISDACGGIEVIDRTALILHIFSLRAKSRQAKLQTEMARLEYDLPRIMNDHDDGGHERGGAVTNRGGGEMRSEIVARKYQARITDLKEELAKIEERRGQDERRRSKTMLKRAALVGYTNAGKSSLMNAMLKRCGEPGSEVWEQDMLFATLDTSVRKCKEENREYLLYDTVGFVSDLPHMLVEAFKSTLDAARDADLLIHVVDASDPDWEKKQEITRQTLREIGADKIPVLRVYNKIDLAPTACIEGYKLSCTTGQGLDEVSHAMIEMLYPKQKSILCLLPYDKMAMFDAYRKFLQMNILGQDQDGMRLEISGPEKYVEPFCRYSIGKKEG
jgi:GTP-binding protein HflX